MKICVLIPSYNESKTIQSLVTKIKSMGLDVLVVDDGSMDQTSELARSAGAEVFRHQKNQGKGASLKAGFHYALERDYQAVITMDGDGQHSPEDIPNFIAAAAASPAQMIVGNRMHSCQNMPLIRRLTNSVMSGLISLICRRNIRDSQCGFRLIKRELLSQLNPISSNYEIETETIIEARHKGFELEFIPIQTIYAQQASQINPVVDTIRFFKFMLKIFCPFFSAK